jgi:hypothetical protein
VSSEFTPVQQRTLDLLGRTGTPVVFDPGVVAELRDDFRAALAELAERLPDPTSDGTPLVVVTKYDLGEVFTCEAKWMTPTTSRGRRRRPAARSPTERFSC